MSESDQDPQVEPVPGADPAGEPAAERPYTIGSWHGRPNYQCCFCPFASLSAGELLAHVRGRHGPKPKAAGPILVPAKKIGRVRRVKGAE